MRPIIKDTVLVMCHPLPLPIYQGVAISFAVALNAIFVGFEYCILRIIYHGANTKAASCRLEAGDYTVLCESGTITHVEALAIRRRLLTI